MVGVRHAPNMAALLVAQERRRLIDDAVSVSAAFGQLSLKSSSSGGRGLVAPTHVLAQDSPEDQPQPTCRWATAGHRSFFKDSVLWVDSVLTGVALAAPRPSSKPASLL